MESMSNIINDLDYRSKHIFNTIQKKGPVTKSKLMEITKLKLSTLNREIQYLIGEKLVVEMSTGESTGGRKPVLYDVNPRDCYIIGIDISRTYVQIVVTNLKMKIIAEKLNDRAYEIKELEVLIVKWINELLLQMGINKSMIAGIGIGVVNPTLHKDFYKDIFTGEYNVPIMVDNGANTAVIGEYYFGSGRGKENVSYINCGVGIRTGVITSGVLVHTMSDSEDAFAHMIVDLDGEKCSCGNFGCVESYASITKITQRFVSEIKKGRGINLSKEMENINYVDVCNLAENKDETAMDIITDSALHFGTGLSNFIKLFNPQEIILSGPLIKNSQMFYEMSRNTALKKCHAGSEKIEFRRGGYFEDKSMSVGAAAMILQDLLKIKSEDVR